MWGNRIGNKTIEFLRNSDLRNGPAGSGSASRPVFALIRISQTLATLSTTSCVDAVKKSRAERDSRWSLVRAICECGEDLRACGHLSPRLNPVAVFGGGKVGAA